MSTLKKALEESGLMTLIENKTKAKSTFEKVESNLIKELKRTVGRTNEVCAMVFEFKRNPTTGSVDHASLHFAASGSSAERIYLKVLQPDVEGGSDANSRVWNQWVKYSNNLIDKFKRIINSSTIYTSHS